MVDGCCVVTLASHVSLPLSLNPAVVDFYPLLSGSQVEDLPCTDLQTIERLWLKYSDGFFGFTVQKQIYLEEQENYVKLANRLGWRKKGSWYSLVDSKIKGHFPRIWSDRDDLHRRKALFSRLNTCGIK